MVGAFSGHCETSRRFVDSSTYGVRGAESVVHPAAPDPQGGAAQGAGGQVVHGDGHAALQ